MIGHRIEKIHGHQRSQRRNQHPDLSQRRKMSPYQTILAYLKLLDLSHLNNPDMEVRNYFLVTQRKSLESVEPWLWLRWLLRQYFRWRGFACRSHCNCSGGCYASVEYRGVFDDEAAARFAASCEGGEYKPIPFNAALPEETVSYVPGDVPLSEASPWYRRGSMLPFVAVRRSDLEELEKKVDQTLQCANGECAPKVV